MFHRLMAKSFQLEHYQLTNALSIQLVWYSRRSLSSYTPRKPAPSLPLATNLGIARENILPFYFLQYFQRSSNTNFCSLTASLSFITYDSETSTEEDDESDEEVPQAIPLYPNADDDKSKESKCGVEKPAATESSKAKVCLEEAKNPDKHKADVGGTDDDESDEDVDSEGGESGDDENSSDEDDGESSNEEDDEDSPKSAKRKNRPAETPLKTPLGKKARITTPSMGKKTVSDDAKKSNHVHVATPYPSLKQVKMARSIIDSSNQSTGYACKSCSKTFYSSVGLETHCKVKHSTRK
ncbi:histone deacetylase HDT2-like isoform X6 [Miscanthus floridulus]|uniref:histone deacetylase HDT2-like isoform X6 n=1 Tax=Miscanthus floridulus TaxID=154761 RepID=UPI003458274A